MTSAAVPWKSILQKPVYTIDYWQCILLGFLWDRPLEEKMFVGSKKIQFCLIFFL